MDGHTLGKRSAVTCHLKCADACFHPVPNESTNDYFRDIVGAALSRRSLLAGVGVGAAAIVLGVGQTTPALAAPGGPAGGGLSFTPIAPVPAAVDAFSVPSGYSWNPIIRWGDPLFAATDRFDPAHQSAASQALQFGYNNDYLDILEDHKGRNGILVTNHEYTNEGIMFAPATTSAEADDQRRVAMMAHGMSVVALERKRAGQPWTYRVGDRLNRRITASTPFTITGPAAGSDLLKTRADPTGRTVLGTLGNCAGGTTPWGTVLSGEENFNGYFRTPGTSPADARYGLADRPTGRLWERVDDRFDATVAGNENEPNRFGWIVEIDPEAPNEPPVKHTALGRFKHEGANVIVGKTGHVAAYMGDDERFDYLYKFVSHDRFDKKKSPKARVHNKALLTRGSLYVARFTGNSPAGEITGTGQLPADGQFDGTGQWVALVIDGICQVPGFSTDDALVNTRLVADAVGATKMDRCEDVEPSPVTGKIYVACTNNTDRGLPGKEGATEPNPRTMNRDGHIVEITETGSDATAVTFGWNLLLVCGDPKTNSSTYFAGFPSEKVSPISCPDNVAFDAEGNLWISTDGAPSTIGFCDGLFKVPLTGPERGRVQQFLSVPRQAETCGPVIRSEQSMVYVAVQHPGENGSWAAQASRFPDYVPLGAAAPAGAWAGPRPSIVQVWKP
ncbi:PhoX family phosphatase [Cryobacterium sp. PH31-L1]|uniref:PhoX family protein n=1 Tax=Cryobacterium sp. PH31-L1 TaxID=3046199 RepID=UPI0024BBA555|nr:PhoX family phosphatase [Cryobacterium sp. PH31-L1]MDJ0378180.1 PhoX family phosphatase [Cryobacterium sp. PH31-L1]